MATTKIKRVCQKCGIAKGEAEFFTYKNGEKTEWCKQCLTMHLDIWEPDTFMWLLQKMDVPYVPAEWNRLRDSSYAKNPNNKNDKAVFGKYLSKMKLKQWKDKGWADSEALQKQQQLKDAAKVEQEKAEQDLIREQFEKGEITQAQYRTIATAAEQRKLDIKRQFELPTEVQSIGTDNAYNENNFMPEQEIPDLSKDFTLDDKKYLVLKWGRYYTPQQWAELEKNYNEMCQSFEINDADTRNVLIHICKTNLKMNEAIDSGDLQGYKKLASVYEQLRKSAKFTAAQNKEQKRQFIDSIGQLVAYCQREGGKIPKIDISVQRDKVDVVIKDLKEYTRSLIYEDTALARQIEEYLKKRERIEEQKLNKDKEIVVTDEDIKEYNDEILSQQKQDEAMLGGQIE